MKNLICFIFAFLIFICSCDSPKTDILPTERKSKKMNEDITFTTSDNIKIKGTYYYNNVDVSKKQPLIILIHQFMSDRGQWKEELIDSLVARNYKVITYDIRNHGESDKAVGDIQEILKANGNAILDLQAVFKWTKTRSGIDSTRIAIIGTSVGASLALYAKYELGAKTIIGVSIAKGPFEEFTGYSELRMGVAVKKVNSVLLLCGDKDEKYADDAKYIYTTFLDDPRELKLYNSDKHGKDLITTQSPDINKYMLEWLKKYL